ncbi:hypothetical protein ACHAXS_010469, partial [Conticribra weissflogii]
MCTLSLVFVSFQSQNCVPHFTSLHFTSFPFPSLPFPSLHFTFLYFTFLHFCSSLVLLLLFFIF